MSIKVDIQVNAEDLLVTSPYNAIFVTQARKLNGKWTGSAWRFDPRDQDRIRNLCREVYGTDGSIAEAMVTLRVEWTDSSFTDCEPFTVAGRTIARAYGRDSGAKLGENVVLLSGGFGSGGSRANWQTTVSAGTVVLVRDFPQAKADELLAKTDTGKRKYSIEPEKPVVNLDALNEERTKIMARLAEIDALLSETKKATV